MDLSRILDLSLYMSQIHKACWERSTWHYDMATKAATPSVALHHVQVAKMLLQITSHLYRSMVNLEHVVQYQSHKL